MAATHGLQRLSLFGSDRSRAGGRVMRRALTLLPFTALLFILPFRDTVALRLVCLAAAAHSVSLPSRMSLTSSIRRARVNRAFL